MCEKFRGAVEMHKLAVLKLWNILNVFDSRRSKMDNFQGIPQMPWGGHSPISSLYHQQSIQDYKSENNSLYGSPYTPIIHTPDISPVASPEPDGKSSHSFSAARSALLCTRDPEK